MMMKTGTKIAKKTNVAKRGKNQDKVKRKRKAHRLKSLVSYLFTFLLITSLGVGLSVAMLFKIDKITVVGDVPYSYDELINNSGITVGNNLFFINAKASQSNIEKNLPYVEKVSLIRKFPNEIIIKIEPAKREFAFKVSQEFIILSNLGKVLEICNSLPDDVALVKGINLKTFEIGSKATYEDNAQRETFENLIKLMDSNDLSKVTGVDFSRPANIIVNYEHRVDMILGLYEDIDYKLRMAKEIINSKIGVKESGTLDLSTVSKDNRSYFRPSDIN